jgi:hypothetical protein
VPVDGDGEGIVGVGSDGRPKEEDVGTPEVPVNENGDQIGKTDVNGNPVLNTGANGMPVLVTDPETGDPK